MHTVMAPALALALNFFTLVRSPPSSSYRTFRFSATETERACVVWVSADLLGAPEASRARTRLHSISPSAVTTPTSSLPSSGRESSKTRTPPKSSPRLPSRMQLAFPLYQVTPSHVTRALKGFSRRLVEADIT